MFLDLAKRLPFDFGFYYGERSQGFFFGFAVSVVMKVAVHPAADCGPVGSDSDGSGDEFVADADE